MNTKRSILPPDPEHTNSLSAKQAAETIDFFTKHHGEKPYSGITKHQRLDLKAQNLTDLLANIGHYCDREGINLQDRLRIAANHYTAETDCKGIQFTVPVITSPKPLSDPSNLATTLAALRLFQRDYEDCSSDAIYEVWGEHFTSDDGSMIPPLGTDDIDKLCEELNCGSVEDAYQTTPQAEAYRKTAKENYHEEGAVEVDDAATVSKSPEKNAGGAYVQAWAWVSDAEAGICRHCGAVNADNGEGIDDLCGECADKTQCSADDCEEVVDTDSRFFATPCGSFCDEHMQAHMKDCEVCRKAFS